MFKPYSPSREVKLIAGMYGVFAGAQVVVVLMLLSNMDWRVRRVDFNILSGIFFELLLLFMVNLALALGAWYFLRFPRWLRIALLTVAAIVALLCSTKVANFIYIWLSRPQIFAQIHLAFPGALLATASYGFLAIQLIRVERRVLMSRLASPD